MIHNGSTSNKSGETHLRKSLTGERLNVSEILKIPCMRKLERKKLEGKEGGIERKPGKDSKCKNSRIAVVHNNRERNSKSFRKYPV